MSVHEKIIQALSPLGYPVVPDRYTGSEAVYLTFHCVSIGRLFASDAPCAQVCLVQVHLFAPFGQNMLSVRREARRRLFRAGFTWPGEVNAGERTDECQHIVFECEMEEGVNLDG